MPNVWRYCQFVNKQFGAEGRLKVWSLSGVVAPKKSKNKQNSLKIKWLSCNLFLVKDSTFDKLFRRLSPLLAGTSMQARVKQLLLFTGKLY